MGFNKIVYNSLTNLQQNWQDNRLNFLNPELDWISIKILLAKMNMNEI